MLSLILIIAVDLCFTTCFVYAARELERIGNSPNGPRRFPRQWKTLHIVLYASVAGVFAFLALCIVGF